jgi:hypothetical protein
LVGRGLTAEGYKRIVLDIPLHLGDGRGSGCPLVERQGEDAGGCVDTTVLTPKPLGLALL